MGRTLALFCLMIGLVGMGWAALRLADSAETTQTVIPPADGADQTSRAAQMPDATVQFDQPFLPVFGVAPPDVVAPEEQTIAPAPPVFNYRLKGVIASGNMRWAIFSDAERDLLVREGDTIGQDGRILQIHAEGVDIQRGTQTVSMTFSDGDPVAVAAFSPPIVPAATSRYPLPRPMPQKVIYQDMTREEILVVLQQAQSSRRERGWIPARE